MAILSDLSRLVILLSGISTPLATQAAAIVPGRCHMDSCSEMRIEQKTPLRTNAIGTLYEVRISDRSWPMNQRRPSLAALPFSNPAISYVLCSTRRPAIIFQPPQDFLPGVNYVAHLLNPDGQSWYGYNFSSYSIYWATCHNLVGPNFFSPEMVTRAIQLGYPGGLPEDSVQINHPLDLMR